MLKLSCRVIFVGLCSFFALLSCMEKTTEVEMNVKLSVPVSITLETSGVTECAFNLLSGEVLPEDIIVFEDLADGNMIELPTTFSGGKVLVTLYEGFPTGDYKVYLKRGDKVRFMGMTEIPLTLPDDFVPAESTTVWGVVYCGNKVLKDVVVSDGVEVTTTDEKGIYQLASAKKYGYVFISIPGGYEAPLKGVIPTFFKRTNPDASDRADFPLRAVDNTNFTLYFLGDMHLANRMGTYEPQDLTQFKAFADDLNRTRERYMGNEYVVTLGDMSWDQYWWEKKYNLETYLADANKYFKGLSFFHAMGNHDNDFTAQGDFRKENAFRKVIGPNYYSFNLGQVHVIVLDNINYLSTEADTYNPSTGKINTPDHRGLYHTDVSVDQYDWLLKDLQHVSKDTPLIVVGHSQFFKQNAEGVWGGNFPHVCTSNEEFAAAFAGYKVHFFTGHTHETTNYNAMEEKGFYEHNSGAICAAWWWSDAMTSGVNLSVDGSPGGYQILTVNGTDFKWVYKPTGISEDYQFRAYDMNEVKKVIVSSALAANQSQYADKFANYVNAVQAYGENEVLLNIWNYAPEWKISVLESGRKLEYEKVYDYDPLHVLAQSSKKMNFATTVKTHHLFKFKTSSATSPLQIEITDSFGKVYKETMERPKALTISNYKK